jgi:hypothetical protein
MRIYSIIPHGKQINGIVLLQIENDPNHTDSWYVLQYEKRKAEDVKYSNVYDNFFENIELAKEWCSVIERKGVRHGYCNNEG